MDYEEEINEVLRNVTLTKEQLQRVDDFSDYEFKLGKRLAEDPELIAAFRAIKKAGEFGHYMDVVFRKHQNDIEEIL